jgi:hypothetical protein
MKYREFSLRGVIALSAGAGVLGALAGTYFGGRAAQSEYRSEASLAVPATSEFIRLLAQEISNADGVIIEFGHGPVADSVRFSDQTWIGRYAKVLATAQDEPRDLCLCTASPTVHFLRGLKRVATVTVHHGEKIRVSTVGRGVRDFHVGEATARDLSTLALQRRNVANQSPEPTSGSVTPRAIVPKSE